MMRRSPMNHRHDGTSPLPLGMDWSPPPRKWNGKDTVWPHDPRTGWSYCATIPSWSLLPVSRNSDPVVFYRVQVGVQSPEGRTTLWGVLRRFNDFLKLYAHLKNAFPKKNLPPAPPKGLMRLKTRELLDERRLSLEDWLTKLLSDIDVSRSVAIASFLELEAAARASFQDVNQHASEVNQSGNGSNSSAELHPGSSHLLVAGSSSLASYYGSDTAYETSELGTPRLGIGRDSSNSEVGLEDLALDDASTSTIEKLVEYGMSNFDEGLFMGQTLLEELEGFPKYDGDDRQRISSNGKNTENRFDSRSALANEGGKDLILKVDHNKAVGHTRKLSAESVSTDVGSIRGSDISELGNPVFYGNGSHDLLGSSEDLNITNILDSKNSQLILPLDQRQKLSRYLSSMQRRLGTAKTDMEELLSRLDQEIAVKEYLATKVKDIEVELESIRQKSKENLQQAVLLERERYTQIQWDMEELKRKSLEMEIQLKSRQLQGEKPHTQPTSDYTAEEKDALLQELGTEKEQLKSLQKHHEELELKSKADIKVLVKEVKSLRSSQKQLKEELTQLDQERVDAQRLLQEEKLKNDNSVAARRKFLDECKAVQKQLQECNKCFLSEEEDNLVMSSSSETDALDLLTASDNQIGLLIEEVQRLGHGTKLTDVNRETDATDTELRIMLTEIFTETARLRKQLNSVTRHSLKLEVIKLEKDL